MKSTQSRETRHPCTKRYNQEFRTEALALLKAGRGNTQLARELGVSAWTLTRWKKEAREGAGGAAAGQAGPGPVLASGGGPSALASAQEVAALRAELVVVTRQRDILKKALGILGQDQSSGTN
jgi:transposase-like protein